MSGGVVIARPVDWHDLGLDPEYVAQLARSVAAANGASTDHDPLTGIYPGSVVLPCAGCAVRCWVGPRGAAAVASAGARVGCVRCVAAAHGGSLDGVPVVPLGNPDTARRPRP